MGEKRRDVALMVAGVLIGLGGSILSNIFLHGAAVLVAASAMVAIGISLTVYGLVDFRREPIREGSHDHFVLRRPDTVSYVNVGRMAVPSMSTGDLPLIVDMQQVPVHRDNRNGTTLSTFSTEVGLVNESNEAVTCRAWLVTSSESYRMNDLIRVEARSHRDAPVRFQWEDPAYPKELVFLEAGTQRERRVRIVPTNPGDTLTIVGS